MKVSAKWILLPTLLLQLISAACSVNETYAPVVNAWQDPSAMKSRYRVQKDDTVYSIALAFDMDYRDLVRANHLNPPYHLKPGETLTMHIGGNAPVSDIEPEGGACSTTYAMTNSDAKSQDYQELPCSSIPKTAYKEKACLQLARPRPLKFKDAQMEMNLPEVELKSLKCPCINKKSTVEDNSDFHLEPLPQKTVAVNQDKINCEVNSGRWQWPAKGKIQKEFSLQAGGSKGIDIAGCLGDPIRAVAPGKVVYSGSGLRGYGNLVIIKHSDNYLSAYAYNKKLLVKEGDVVKAGAEIAKMGQNDAGQVLLHFEIRRNGKPVNPLLYL